MARPLVLLCLLVLSALAVASLLPQPALAFFPFGGGRPRNPEDDLYGILGISRSASQQEIKKAFRTVTREEHPDMKTSPEEKERATERMRNVLRAYGVLSDPEKRRQFDSHGIIAGENGAPNSPSAGKGGMPSDVPPEFAHFFRHFGGGGGGGGFRVAPIESATPTITLKQYSTDVRAYRGRRLFLLQFYADRYSSCRLLSPAWEALHRSAMAQTGALGMFRVNIDTEEGARLVAQVLGKPATYSMSVPTVVAVADGILWPMRDIGDFLSSRSQHQPLLAALQGFVQSFYTEYEGELAGGVGNVPSIRNFLTAAVTDPLAKGHAASLAAVAEVRPVRVVVSANGDLDASIAVGVALDDPKVEIRFAPRLNDMIDVVTRVCQRSIGLPTEQLASLVLLMNETIIDNAFDPDASFSSGPQAGLGGGGASTRHLRNRGVNQQSGSTVRPPVWCKSLFIAPMRTAWRPKLLLNFVRSSFTKDSDVMLKKFPDAIPIIRSPADFAAHCSPPVRRGSGGGKGGKAGGAGASAVHYESSRAFVSDVKGKYCAIYVVNQCDGTKRAKGRGIAKTFMEPPQWAANRARARPFELVGVCLDRQPKLLHTLTSGGAAGPRLAAALEREDFMIMHDYSEPTRVGVYTHSDIARGGPLTALGVVLAAFLEDKLSQQPFASVVQLMNGRSLADGFLTEPAHHVDVDNRAVYGRALTGHSLPPLVFPVSGVRWWAWRAADGYRELPFSSFIVIILVYIVYNYFAGGGGGVQNNNAGYENRNRNTQQQQRGTAPTGARGTAPQQQQQYRQQQQQQQQQQRYQQQPQPQQQRGFPQSSPHASPPQSPNSRQQQGVLSIVRPLDLRRDVAEAGGFLVVFIPREGHGVRNVMAALDDTVSRHAALMTSDARFTMRLVLPAGAVATSPASSSDPNSNVLLWQQWASILESEADEGRAGSAGSASSSSEPSSPLAAKCLYVIAIRAKRRLAAVKPSGTPFDHWCEELADGSAVANKPMPRNFIL